MLCRPVAALCEASLPATVVAGTTAAVAAGSGATAAVAAGGGVGATTAVAAGVGSGAPVPIFRTLLAFDMSTTCTRERKPQ